RLRSAGALTLHHNRPHSGCRIDVIDLVGADGQVLNAPLHIDPVPLGAPTARIVNRVALDRHIAVRGITRGGRSIHHAPAPAIHRFTVAIVDAFVAASTVVAQPDVGRT